jgi:outer membrane protein insertion porin family
MQFLMRFQTAAIFSSFLFFTAHPCRADVESAFLGRTILTIEYAADQTLNRTRFDAVIGLKPGDPLTQTGMKNALQALYDTGRFSMIAADASSEGDGIKLRFLLRLNYYFNRFVINAPLDLRGRKPWEVMPLPVGERFTPERLEEARQIVLKYMKDQGYFLAEVSARTETDESKRQIDTYFDVKAGRLATVRSVTITGVPALEEKSLRSALGATQGKKYRRPRVMRRLDSIKESFINRGYLAVVPEFSESFEASDNTVVVILNVTNFGRVRVKVDGFKVEKPRLRHLLPVLSGEGAQSSSLEEGAQNLRDYLEESGYPEAVVEVREERDKDGTRVVIYGVDAGRKVTVEYVHFQGNHALTESQLEGALQVQPARLGRKSVYSIANLDSDVDSLKSLYNSRGYLDAAVIPLVKPVGDASRLGITYVCEEGRLSRAKSVTIVGNKAIPADTLRAKMQLKPGGSYSSHIAERDRQSLLAVYNDAGFLQARVSYQAGTPDAEGAYPIEFRIEELVRSLIDEVIVLGNRRTRNSLLDKRIDLHPNDPLSLGKMLETQQSLYNIGVFDRVRVSPQNPDSATPFQNVVVRLDETQRYTVRYGLGYQEREKVRGTIQLSDLNILGLGKRADLNLRVSGIEELAALSFHQPQFRYLPVDSYLNLSAQRKLEVSYDVKRLNLSYQLGRPLSSHSWGLLRYNFRNVHVYNSQVEPLREDTPRNLSTISAIYINETRDDYLDPEKGFFTSTSFGITPRLLGSNNYISLYSQNSYYRPLRGSMSFAASLRIGLSHPYGRDTDLPISERFFAGGASSLRGFDTDTAGPLDPVTNAPTGGNAVFIGNLELRTPPWHFVGVAGFYDTGNVYRYVHDFNLSEFSHTVGLGLRIKTPFGPLRADYGFNLNLPGQLRERGLKSGHFFITIGPPF